jgi:hypothetical protein
MHIYRVVLSTITHYITGPFILLLLVQLLVLMENDHLIIEGMH